MLACSARRSILHSSSIFFLASPPVVFASGERANEWLLLIDLVESTLNGFRRVLGASGAAVAVATGKSEEGFLFSLRVSPAASKQPPLEHLQPPESRWRSERTSGSNDEQKDGCERENGERESQQQVRRLQQHPHVHSSVPHVDLCCIASCCLLHLPVLSVRATSTPGSRRLHWNDQRTVRELLSKGSGQSATIVAADPPRAFVNRSSIWIAGTESLSVACACGSGAQEWRVGSTNYSCSVCGAHSQSVPGSEV